MKSLNYKKIDVKMPTELIISNIIKGELDLNNCYHLNVANNWIGNIELYENVDYEDDYRETDIYITYSPTEKLQNNYIRERYFKKDTIKKKILSIGKGGIFLKLDDKNITLKSDCTGPLVEVRLIHNANYLMHLAIKITLLDTDFKKIETEITKIA